MLPNTIGGNDYDSEEDFTNQNQNYQSKSQD